MKSHIESVLVRALRAEADHVMPVGDGLSKIRARTESRRSVFGWFAGPAARPLLAGGTLVLTLIAGSMLGDQLRSGRNSGTLADRSSVASSTPVVDLPADVLRNRSDLGIPQDDGGNYVAILAPLSGRTYSSRLALYGQARV